MIVSFASEAWADLVAWRNDDLGRLPRVIDLIGSACATPFTGLGKPEPLKYVANLWSRRITDEHRLTYFVAGKRGAEGAEAQRLSIVRCRGHYT